MNEMSVCQNTQKPLDKFIVERKLKKIEKKIK